MKVEKKDICTLTLTGNPRDFKLIAEALRRKSCFFHKKNSPKTTKCVLYKICSDQAFTRKDICRDFADEINKELRKKDEE